jgi:UDP-2,3-diacylglucosamine pyrophosphatase LpxH
VTDPSQARRSPRAIPAADRLLVILSDIEMGTGGPTDDFPHTDYLAGVIAGYNQGPFAELAVDLVFNGDTFDLLKTPFESAFPRHITAPMAVAKLEQIAAVHGDFFASIREFLTGASAGRRVHFVVGNHDAELVFPEVQELIRRLCGDDPRILFPGFRLQIDRVLIEHGSQLDPMFRVDEAEPFFDFEGARILKISWGAAALLDTLIPLKALLGFHDRLKPRELVLELIPEIRELLMDRFWSYWLHDFWKGYFHSSDPTRQITWEMLKEVIWRASSKNTDVLIEGDLLQRMSRSDDILLYVIGHMHEAQWTSHGDRKILQSGCLRNEYMISPRGESLWPMPKSYIEAWTRNGRPVISALVELEGPPAPEGYVPASIFDVVPEVLALGDPASRAALLEERQAHERKTR